MIIAYRWLLVGLEQRVQQGYVLLLQIPRYGYILTVLSRCISDVSVLSSQAWPPDCRSSIIGGGWFVSDYSMCTYMQDV